MNDETLLSIRDLNTSFKINNKYYPAIKDINLDVCRDETLAIVGESGCGKSTLAQTVMGLLNQDDSKSSGKADFLGTNLIGLSESKINEIRVVKIGIILQDPL